MAWNVVILGGGFGGLTAARRLERKLPHQSATVTLVNDANFMLYTPLLPGAAGGTLEPRHVVVPLREQLHRTVLHLGHGAPARTRTARRVRGPLARRPRGGAALRPADRRARLDLADAPDPRARRARRRLQDAARGDRAAQPAAAVARAGRDRARRGGPARAADVRVRRRRLRRARGLAELQDFAADVVERYPRCSVAGHALRARRGARAGDDGDRSPSSPSSPAPSCAGAGSRSARDTTRGGDHGAHGRALDRRGRPRRARWSGRRASSRTRSSRSSGSRSTGGGRIAADRFCAVEGRPGVWAIGDAAAVPDPAAKGKRRRRRPPSTSLRQAQGRGGQRRRTRWRAEPQRRRPFRYRTLGVFVDMGRHQAVASTLGIRWRGFPAWFLARTYHLALMPGLGPPGAAGDGLDGRAAVRPRLGGARPARAPAELESNVGRRAESEPERTNVDPGRVGSETASTSTAAPSRRGSRR